MVVAVVAVKEKVRLDSNIITRCGSSGQAKQDSTHTHTPKLENEEWCDINMDHTYSLVAPSPVFAPHRVPPRVV